MPLLVEVPALTKGEAEPRSISRLVWLHPNCTLLRNLAEIYMLAANEGKNFCVLLKAWLAAETSSMGNI